MKKVFLMALLIATYNVCQIYAAEVTIFQDNFDSGASSSWGNENGAWQVLNGEYKASYNSTNPPTYSSVTTLTDLEDFTIYVDVRNTQSGGIFLRNNGVNGISGVALITNPGYGKIYWHIFYNNDCGQAYNLVDFAQYAYQDISLKITVEGDNYTAYVNGQEMTSLTTSAYSSGSVALYAASDVAFDNFRVTAEGSPIPEPSTIILLSLSIAGAVRKLYFTKTL